MIDEKTGLDTDIIEVLDWDFEVPCDVPQFAEIECDHAAEWRMVASCCGHTFLFCDFHKEGIEAGIHMYANKKYECDVCRRLLNGATDYFILVERL